MRGQRPTQENDPLLVPFLDAADELAAQRLLQELIELAAPTIKKITAWARDPEDAFQKTAQQLVEQLWDLKSDPQRRAIGRYLRYVKVVASHVAKGQLRDEHPQRRSLVDALRYTLKANQRFTSWPNETRDSLWGLACWEGSPSLSPERSQHLKQLLDNPRLLDDVLVPSSRTLDHADLLTKLFTWVGHPIRFDDLVKILCDFKQLDPAPLVTTDVENERYVGELVPDAGPRPDEVAEWGEFLGQLWAEIEQLPRLQRSAYLLNFTAGDGQLELFWAYGVVSIRQIGRILELSEEQFAQLWQDVTLTDKDISRAHALRNYDERFALLWQYLPLSDAVIGRVLGVERQRIINLRKAASDRLTRRMTSRARPKLSAAVS
ncbi:MAG TPA: hypothetical protein VKM94_03900 [Blastocatellia bacterium]|nr:hypothetical protein [Blastocatellia bacterium]